MIGPFLWGRGCSQPISIPAPTENAHLGGWCKSRTTPKSPGDAKLYLSNLEVTSLIQTSLASLHKDLGDVGHRHLIVESLNVTLQASVHLRQAVKRFHHIKIPVAYTDINMDPTRDLSRIGQENPSDPPSPNTGEDLFSQFFDWDRYLDDAAPWEKQAHRATPQHLDKLITDIHPLIDSLGSHRFFTMGNSFGSDDEAASSSSPGYSGHPSPPELVQGEGSTSPSDHSGPVLPEQALGVYDTPTASLAEIRNHDDQWTYPQTYSSSSGSSSPTQHRISHHDADPKPPLVHVPGPGATRPAVTTTSTRKRQLENPDQTADVRKSGACLPCRITKTRVRHNGSGTLRGSPPPHLPVPLSPLPPRLSP